MFILGERLQQALLIEESGIWIIVADNETDPTIVVKLPTPLIKGIHTGLPTMIIANSSGL